MGSFSTDLDKFIEKAGKNADAVIRKVVLDIGAELVEMSPVGDGSSWISPPPAGYSGGRFRSNWSHSVGNASTNQYDTTSASDSMDRITSSLPMKASGLVHYITNNLPYAQRLEDGWSKQAPVGMVSITATKFQSFINDAVKEVD